MNLSKTGNFGKTSGKIRMISVFYNYLVVLKLRAVAVGTLSIAFGALCYSPTAVPQMNSLKQNRPHS